MKLIIQNIQAIIGDIQEAGWSVKVPRENVKNVVDIDDQNTD